jgi:hypothetical protein
MPVIPALERLRQDERLVSKKQKQNGSKQSMSKGVFEYHPLTLYVQDCTSFPFQTVILFPPTKHSELD